MADYTPDYKGIGELMRSPMMHGVVELAAYEAIPFARSISPDDPPYGEGYVASFEVHGGTAMVAHRRRASADLVNTAPYAVEVELGQVGDVSRADTGHHVLARTVDWIEHHG